MSRRIGPPRARARRRAPDWRFPICRPARCCLLRRLAGRLAAGCAVRRVASSAAARRWWNSRIVGALCLSSPGRRDGAATRGVSAMHRPAQRRSEADCGGYAEGLLEGGGFGGWGRRELRVGEAVGVLRRAVCVHHTPFRGVRLQDCYSGLTHLAVCRQGAFAPGRAHHQAWRRQRGGRA